jgi:hypothetical protein
MNKHTLLTPHMILHQHYMFRHVAIISVFVEIMNVKHHIYYTYLTG